MAAFLLIVGAGIFDREPVDSVVTTGLWVLPRRNMTTKSTQNVGMLRASASLERGPVVCGTEPLPDSRLLFCCPNR